MPNKLYARIATKILFFVCGINFASWASRIPEVKEHLHLGDAQLGTILLALPFGNLTALPIAGMVIGKFGSRKIALIATFIYFIAMPLVGFSATTLALMASSCPTIRSRTARTRSTRSEKRSRGPRDANLITSTCPSRTFPPHTGIILVVRRRPPPADRPSRPRRAVASPEEYSRRTGPDSA